MESADLLFENISVGDSTSFERVFTEEDVRIFAELTGDRNPLHTDEAYAATTRFGKPLVHGMLAGALCSTLVGMHLPGKRCLYLRQSLSFKQPVFIGETLIVRGVVSEKVEATRMLSLAVSITSNGIGVIEGEARVQVLS